MGLLAAAIGALYSVYATYGLARGLKPADMTFRKAGLIAGVPVKRAGTPEEIAEAIVFLASNKASFITGQVVGVNGGKTAS
jgi:NAD(P)-dependent dehydrogenase (short-subunit alcohol dehydrogenase family)